MADITDPTVIAFCNNFARLAGDRMIGLDSTIDVNMSLWFATISPLIAGNADGDIILDGSANDGRTVNTKADLVNLITQTLAYQAQLNGGGVFDVVNKWAVHPTSFTF